MLACVPLMQGGGDSGMIKRWVAEARQRFTVERDRADLGLITRAFATLGGCRNIWDQVLRGWPMKTSPIFDEIRDEGREEGRQLGQIEGMRSLVLGLGRQKFGKIPTRKQQQALEAIDDLARMQTLAQRLLEADSWGTLLNGGGR